MAKQQKINSIYVIAGQDIHLRDQALRQLREKLLGKDEGLGEIRCEGKSVELVTVLDELRTAPFLAERKVVIIDDADKFVTDNRERLEEYFNAPSPTGVLVLIVDTWRKATRLDKQLAKIGELILAEPMKGRELVSWVVSRALQLGKTLPVVAASELVETVGEDTGRLANELEKLALFVGDRRQISSEDIVALSGHTATENVFLITDLMAEGKTAEVTKVLNSILESDRSAEYSMVGVLTFSIRRLLKARSMLDSGMKQGEVLSACKIYPGIAERFIAQVRRFSAERLRSMIDELAKLDYANKTGLGQPRMNLEKFILCATSNS